MTKILHVVGSLASSHGGPSRSVPALAGGLAARGITCTIMHAGSDGDEPLEVAAAVDRGVIIESVSNRRNASVIGFDVVHLHGLWSALLHSIGEKAFRARIPVVVSPRGMLQPWARRHHRFRKDIAWWLFQERDLRRSSLLHATSDEEARNLELLGFSNAVVVPNGTEIPARTAEFSGEPRIVVLSRLHTVKGLAMLVEAAARNRDELRRGGWRIVIAGSDQDGHKAELLRAIAQHEVADLFTFAGEVSGEAKWNLLRSGFIFILPSRTENFGIAIAEALAAGVPVITTTATPWREIEDRQCGWWVAPKTDAIATALSAAVRTETAELRAMGLRGRELVSSKYSWESAALQFESVYNGLIVRSLDR